ncbi:Usp17lc [Symbiodinium sp. CCMP2592]|nr:Usp17lc [Symbiodinium sp. CCMP2592]
MSLPPGFVNLGASCFINASLQAVISVPALKTAILNGSSNSEVALQAILQQLTGGKHVTPRTITSDWYHGRQEDAAEFLVRLLVETPALHPPLRGLEVPRFRCRHCDWERPSQPEEFLSLHLPLVYGEPQYSVKAALDAYLADAQVRHEFRGWTCGSAECAASDRAFDAPLGLTNIQNWPRVLMLVLKRWETIHNVIGHKVHCDNTLAVAGQQYQLQSVVTHIGRTASSGHYVAYTRHCSGWVRFSDTAVSQVPPNVVGDFVGGMDEKVYIAFYVQVPVQQQPDPPRARLPAIDLDPDSDSDVLVDTDACPQQEQVQSYTDIPSPNSQDITAASDDGKKRSSSAAASGTVKKPRTSSLTSMEHALIDTTLKNAKSVKDALKQLEAEIPGFTVTDKTAPAYVPRTTLRYRFKHRNNLKNNWNDESKLYFKPFLAAPVPRAVEPATFKAAAWAQTQAWTFCNKCGRHRPRTQSQPAVADIECKPACDPAAKSLLLPGEVPESRKLMAYVTPQREDWNELLEALGSQDLAKALTAEDLDTLVIVRLFVDYKTVRGGKSGVTSLKKQSIVRAEWRDQPMHQVPRKPAAAAAFLWFLNNNSTYKEFVDMQEELHRTNADGNSSTWRRLSTADLLLNKPGIEIAVKPWLYPYASYGDSDISVRLKNLNLIKPTSKPSLRTSWERKTCSRCASYANDFLLQSLLYDIAMARTISTVCNLAISTNMAPEAVAADMDTFETYWQNQIHRMEDICRLEFERHQCMEQAMPSIFITVAPAEWTFPLQEGLFFEESLSRQQTMLTRHIYHVLDAFLQEYLLKDGSRREELGIRAIRQWSFRYEFQSRGTIHVHCILWADLLPGVHAEQVQGRTGERHHSALVRHLETLFNCRVDVQASEGRHNLMRYVMGYVQKASDALSFKTSEACSDSTTWRTTYRLLCKKAPLEQELALEFAGLSMVRHSFLGANYYAPIPGSQAKNVSRSAYNAFQEGIRRGHYGGYCFLSWLRDHRVEPLPRHGCKVTPRANRSSDKDVGVAIQFPFELLDIFLGAWAATFLIGMDEQRLLPWTSADYPQGFAIEKQRRDKFEAPQGCHHLKAVLCLNEFQTNPATANFAPDVNKLLVAIEHDLVIRGLTADRIATFKARINASALLLQQVAQGREDPEAWSARRIFELPQRVWSREQQEVLDIIAKGTNMTDANEIKEANRLLHVKGGPGTGKTEVIIAAAQRALDDGCKVLIAGPIGLLVALYRTRLAPSPNLTMETLHASFKVTRSADEQYVPPGRLRSYDLIIFDEISQIDAHVWKILQTALAELYPQPFIVFVGDFQQLQPILGVHQLQLDLERQAAQALLPTIELQPHAAARSTDPVMLDFLGVVRERQPSRQSLERFFDGRMFSKNPVTAARQAKAFEIANEQTFTFLTVTNRGAYAMNMQSLKLDFPEAAASIESGAGYPADSASGQDRILVEVGMRLRLTRNLDKDRGFVNGNLGIVKSKLRPDVFVVKTIQGVLILVHPVTIKGHKFIPACYAYATTIRRAQGATLGAACLCFDRRRPDRGYAYVGASRVKQHTHLFHMGPVRRTDWLPVNGNPDQEQILPSVLSESTYSDDEPEPDSSTISEPGTEDFEIASSTDPDIEGSNSDP